MPESNLTVTFNWEWAVMYMGNGGTFEYNYGDGWVASDTGGSTGPGVNEGVSEIEIRSHEAIQEGSMRIIPPAGKKFDSWNTMHDGSGTKYMPGAIVPYPGESYISLYAQWVDNSKGQCGDDVWWTLDLDTGVMDITGTGVIWEFEWGGNNVPWFSYRDNIKTVNIAGEVTSVGSWAFYGCGKLESANMPGVTYVAGMVFGECTNLINV
ncbi:MAG: leucine-rich repeat domain-containing protein, partial [Oscillospiraceae bacterium]|nr:leucine-rich repeat domain-containing protein [Oscillospiraceae bacterium]